MSDDFERPPAAAPPPLDEWLLRSDRADRYREPFFCGRTAEYEAFRNGARALARGVVGGETLVFQGAPGAGKSALMHECIAAVRTRSTPDEPWAAVEVAPGTLRFPATLTDEIADAVGEERSRLAASASRLRGAIEKGAQRARGTFASAARRGGGVMGLSVGGEKPRDSNARAAFQSIERFCRGTRVVVFVDEAQNTPEDAAADVLDCMHRGLTRIELLPVFLGLGDTADVLAKRGLSRPPAGRLLHMLPLAESDAQNSLRMAFDAYGMHGAEIGQWRAELAALSQGWPQHLNRVAVGAVRVAMKYEMSVDRAPLADALALGSASKIEYYRSRFRGVPGGYLGLYKRLAMQMPTGECPSLPEDEIRDFARAAGIVEHADQAEWFATSLHHGLLAPSPDATGHYCIPIPSLAAYLRDLHLTPSPIPTTSSEKDSGDPPQPAGSHSI